jgi:hypothetical protein
MQLGAARFCALPSAFANTAAWCCEDQRPWPVSEARQISKEIEKMHMTTEIKKTNKTLLRGQFVYSYNLPTETTEEDLQAMIAERTGCVLALDRILITKNAHTCRAVISIGHAEIIHILNWGLQDDSLYGKPVVFETNRNPQPVANPKW